MDWDRDIGLFFLNILMLSIFVLLIVKRKILTPYGNYLILAMGINYFTDLMAFYIRVNKNIKDLYILYLYLYGILFLFFLIIFLMYQKVILNPLFKKIATFIIIVFLGNFFISTIFFVELKKEFPDSILIVNVFLLLCLFMLFLLDTFKTDIILVIKNYYLFWFSLGLVVLYVGLLPSIIVSRVATKEMTSGLWSFILFFINFIGYGIMFIGLFFAKKVNR